MKKLVILGMAVVVALTLSGCGDGGGSASRTIVTTILSNPLRDGDIAYDPLMNTYTVTQGNAEILFAGIDPGTGIEYRTFLHFPLSGPTGIPLNAIIVSATLDVLISDIRPQPLTGTIPILVELVSFQPPILIGTDFDLAILRARASTTIIPPISQADFGNHVPVDVTALMTLAQQLGLADFQLRILVGSGASSAGLIGINDTTGASRGAFAPLLQVEYF